MKTSVQEIFVWHKERLTAEGLAMEELNYSASGPCIPAIPTDPAVPLFLPPVPLIPAPLHRSTPRLAPSPEPTGSRNTFCSLFFHPLQHAPNLFCYPDVKCSFPFGCPLAADSTPLLPERRRILTCFKKIKLICFRSHWPRLPRGCSSVWHHFLTICPTVRNLCSPLHP